MPCDRPNHGGVIGAEMHWGDADGDGAALAQLFAQALISGDSPGNKHLHGAELLGEARCLLGEHVNDGFLELPRDVGHGILSCVHDVEDRGLEAAEAEVVCAAHPRTREMER